MRTFAPASLCLLLCLASCRTAPVSPLVRAARSGDAAAIRTLAQAGADLDRREGVNSWTPLMHAVHRQQPSTVRALLAAGADPNAPGPGGFTPLMMAASYGAEEIVRDLLRAGANPRERDSRGNSAADLALSGIPDFDRFTVTACQPGALRAVLEAAPELSPRPKGLDHLTARAKTLACPDLAAVLRAGR